MEIKFKQITDKRVTSYERNRDAQKMAWRNDSNLLKEKSCYYWSTDSRRCSPSSRRVYAAAAGAACQSRPRTSCRRRSRSYCQCGSSSSTPRSACWTHRSAASAWPSSRRVETSRNRAHAAKRDRGIAREKRGGYPRLSQEEKKKKKEKKENLNHHAVNTTTRSRPHSFKLRSFHAPHAPSVRYGRRWWIAAQRPIRSQLTRRPVAATRITRAPIGRCSLTMLTAPSSAPTMPLPAVRRVYFKNSHFLVNSGKDTAEKNKWKLFFPPAPSFPQ